MDVCKGKKLDVIHYTTRRHIAVVFSSHSIWTNESKLAEYLFARSVCFFLLFSPLRERESKRKKEREKKNVGKEYAVDFR